MPRTFKTGPVFNYDSNLVLDMKLNRASSGLASGFTLPDSSVYSNNAIVRGNPRWKRGTFNNVLDLDGSDDYLEIQDSSSLNIKGDFTLEILATQTAASGAQWLMGKGKTAYRLGVKRTGKLTIGVTSNGVYKEACVGTTVQTVGTQYHMVGTYSSNTGEVALYLDRILEDTGIYPADGPDSNNENFVIGAPDEAPTSELWNGSIEYARVYTRVLSPSEIEARYFSGVENQSTARITIADVPDESNKNIDIEYLKQHIILRHNNDVPSIDRMYHRSIVWGALAELLETYGTSENHLALADRNRIKYLQKRSEAVNELMYRDRSRHQVIRGYDVLMEDI